MTSSWCGVWWHESSRPIPTVSSRLWVTRVYATLVGTCPKLQLTTTWLGCTIWMYLWRIPKCEPVLQSRSGSRPEDPWASGMVFSFLTQQIGGFSPKSESRSVFETSSEDPKHTAIRRTVPQKASSDKSIKYEDPQSKGSLTAFQQILILQPYPFTQIPNRRELLSITFNNMVEPSTVIANMLSRDVGVPISEPKAGIVFSIVLSLISIAALSICFCMSPGFLWLPLIIPTARRIQNVRDWSKLPLVCWCRLFNANSYPRAHVALVILFIYTDSIVFVAGTVILSNGYGVDSSKSMCAKAVLLCLGCYMTTKVSWFHTTQRTLNLRAVGSKLYHSIQRVTP